MADLALITGATGFAGSHLLELLLESGVGVAAWSNPHGHRATTSDPRVLWQAVEKLTATTLAPERLGGFRYVPDTSTPELTRRQLLDRTRAERAKSGTSGTAHTREGGSNGRSSTSSRPATRGGSSGGRRSHSQGAGRSRSG